MPYQSGDPQDQPEPPSGPEVMHTPVNQKMQMGRLLQVPTGHLNMYMRIPLGHMIQLDPPIPSIQGKAEGS